MARYSGLASAALALVVSACSVSPALEEQTSTDYPGLHVVSNSGFREAWARPDANLSRYRVIEIGTLGSADAKIIQPSSSSRIRRDWQLTPEREAALARTWHEAMAGAADKAGLDSGGEGEQVLGITASLTQIAPSADLQQFEQATGPNRVYTEDSGEAAIEMRLYDQASGQLLVVIKDKRRVGPRMWGLASTVSASADVRNLFNSWSNQLLSRVTADKEPLP